MTDNRTTLLNILTRISFKRGNFTLFAGVLYQTGGFRHLERLTG